MICRLILLRIHLLNTLVTTVWRVQKDNAVSKKMYSKVRSSSVPVHTKEKYQKTVSTPLIKDMFRRQSIKRQRVTSPTPNPEDHVSKDEATSCVSTTYTLGDKSAHDSLRDIIENR